MRLYIIPRFFLLAACIAVLPGEILSAATSSPSQASSKEIVNDTHNFAIRPPGKSWQEFPASGVNKVACLALRKQKPSETMAVFIAEKNASFSSQPLEFMTDLVRSNITLNGGKIASFKVSDTTIAGTLWNRIEAMVNFDSLDLRYVYFVTVGNERAYQVVVFGPAKTKTLVDYAADDLMESFRWIDADKAPRPARRQMVATWKSDIFGYSMDLSDRDYFYWPEFDKKQITAEIAFLGKPDKGLSVIPVRLAAPPASINAVATAFLGTIGIPFPDPSVEILKREKSGGIQELSVVARVKGSTDFTYVFRFLLRDRSALSVGAWAETGTVNVPDMLIEDVARIHWDNPPRENVTLPVRLANSPEIMNGIGLYHYKAANFPEAEIWFSHAATADPASIQYKVNIGDCLFRRDLAKQALERLATTITDPAATAEHHVRFAVWQEAAGDPKAAAREFATAFSMGYNVTEDAVYYLDLLLNDNRPKDAVEAADAIDKGRGTTAILLKKAYALEKADRIQDGIDLLTEIRKREPHNALAALNLGWMLHRRDDFKAAIAIADALLAEGRSEQGARRLRGFSLWGSLEYAQARAEFEKILAQSPKDEEALDARIKLSGLLGEGLAPGKNILPCVEVPDRLLEPGKPKAADMADEDIVYPLRLVAYDYAPGKPLRRTSYIEGRVLTEAGARRNTQLAFSFDPLTEKIHVNRAEVYAADGKLVGTTLPSDLYTEDDLSTGQATHDKILQVPLHGLAAGTSFRVTLTWDRTITDDKIDFSRHWFASSEPTINSTLVLLAPKDLVRTLPQGSLREEKIEGGTAWIANRPAPFRSEPLINPNYPESPLIVWGPLAETWAAVGDKYLGEISAKLKLAPVLADSTRQLIVGTTGTHEIIRLITEKVRRTVNYRAVEFGRRGRLPNLAETTLANHSGDCKDHSLLLHQMLKAADIESHLVLASTSAPVIPETPSIDQFNHMVVFIPVLGDNGFVDLTDKSFNPLEAPHPGLVGTHALILSGEGKSRLAKVTAPKQTRNTIDIKRKATLRDDGTFGIREDLTLNGQLAAWMRYWFEQNTERSEMPNQLERSMRLEGYRLFMRSLSSENLEDRTKPLILHMEYDVERRGSSFDGAITAVVPAVTEAWYLARARMIKRYHGFYVREDFTIHSNTTITTSGTKTITAASSGIKKGHDDFYSWKTQIASAPGQLEYTLDVRVNQGEFPAKRWHQSVEAAESILSTVELALTAR